MSVHVSVTTILNRRTSRVSHRVICDSLPRMEQMMSRARREGHPQPTEIASLNGVHTFTVGSLVRKPFLSPPRAEHIAFAKMLGCRLRRIDGASGTELTTNFTTRGARQREMLSADDKSQVTTRLF